MSEDVHSSDNLGSHYSSSEPVHSHERVHEMPEELAAEAIEQEKESAAEVLGEVATQPEVDQAELALRYFFGIPASEQVPDESEITAKQRIARLQRHEAFILGLRALADLYQAHPEIDLPDYPSAFTIYNIGKDKLPIYARAFGQLEKVYDESSFKLVKDFGGKVVLQTYSSRQMVCERVKVGEKVVPAHVIPAKPAEDARIVEEEVVGVYEWKCPEVSLLRPAEAAEAGDPGESTSGDVEAIPEFTSESPAADVDQPF